MSDALSKARWCNNVRIKELDFTALKVDEDALKEYKMLTDTGRALEEVGLA